MSNPHQLNGTADRNVSIAKTLYVKPLTGKLNRDDVLSHFSAFGDVRSVRIRSKPTHSYGFVTFTRAESATRALENDFHVIAGRSVKAAIAHDRHQDGATNDGPSLLDLNDDCIHEILSTKCLDALDLCSVAETCRRLKEIAGRVFRRKHGKCDLDSLANSELKSARRILRNFGAVMSDLEIDGWFFKDNETSVLESVARHCSGTLKSLYLRGCVIPDNVSAKWKPMFNNLRKLKIDNCRFEGASKELFSDCGSLVGLDLWGGDVGFVVENTFSKLQKFKCDSRTANGINFNSFILRHKTLRSITIYCCLENASLLPLIGEICKQLEELEFLIHGDQTFDLSNFGHLRKLHIRWMRNDMKAVRGWNNLQFLENLTVQVATIDPEFIETLSQLKRLRVLRFWECHGLSDLHRFGDLTQLTELEIQSSGNVALDLVLLIKRLSNLKAITAIGHGFEMHLETYLRIVDVVRARPDKSKLTFTLLKSFGRSHTYDADMLRSFSLNAEIVEMITKN